MKKLLAVLLSVLMMFSLVSFTANATDDASGNTGTEIVTPDSGSTDDSKDDTQTPVVPGADTETDTEADEEDEASNAVMDKIMATIYSVLLKIAGWFGFKLIFPFF